MLLSNINNFRCNVNKYISVMQTKKVINWRKTMQFTGMPIFSWYHYISYFWNTFSLSFKTQPVSTDVIKTFRVRFSDFVNVRGQTAHISPAMCIVTLQCWRLIKLKTLELMSDYFTLSHHEHGTGCRRSWSCFDPPPLFVVNWKHFCSSQPKDTGIGLQTGG